MPLKGFRDERKKNKKQIQDFRRIMGKNRTIDTKASEYPSLRRRQAESVGSQSNGWYFFRIANWLSMERIERDWYLFQQYGTLKISGVERSWGFSGTLDDGLGRL